MPETASYNENDPSEFYRLATEKLHKELVGTKQREALISNTLKQKDRLVDGQSLEDYISGEMRFGASIQGLAFAMFCQETPPPYDTREINERFSHDPKLDLNSEFAMKWDYVPLVPLAIEDDLRLTSLGVSPDTFHDQEALVTRPESINTLVRGIIDSAGVVSWMGRDTTNPDQYRDYDSTMQQLLACEPITVEINGKRHWAIKIPATLRGNSQFWRQQAPEVPEYMWDQMNVVEDMLNNDHIPPKPGEYPKANFRQPGDYIVVPDSERNSDLSTFVFANDEALAYMTTKYLGKAQLMLKNKIEFDFNRIIEENISRIKEIVDNINIPVRTEFFDKLLADTGEKGTEIIFIQRNNQDLQAFQGEPFTADPTESPSQVDRFSVTRMGRDMLLFSWPTQDMEGNNVTANVKVRCIGGNFDFANVDTSNENHDINDFTEKFGLPVRRIEDLFNTVGIVTISDWFRYGEKQREGIDNMISALRGCKSSVEYMNKLQEFGKAGFPSRQIIVNPGSKIKFDVDTSKPLSMLKTQWN